MYKIYRRLNLLTGKSYIGLTSQEEKERWKGHISEMKRHPNTKLSRALKKYGVSDDIWQVSFLEDNIEDKYKAGEREIYWIWKYNSYKNGYNSIPGGISGPIKTKQVIFLNFITKQISEFDSIVQAAQAMNIHKQSITDVLRGRRRSVNDCFVFYKIDFDINKLEEYLKKPREKKSVEAIFVDTGEIYKKYNSIEEAANDIKDQGSNIVQVCKKKKNRYTAGQINNRRLTWRYAEAA
jgi:hypothetical protein